MSAIGAWAQKLHFADFCARNHSGFRAQKLHFRILRRIFLTIRANYGMMNCVAREGDHECFSAARNNWKTLKLFGASGHRRLSPVAVGPLSGTEIAARLGEPRNGHLAATLKELAEGGFLSDDQGVNPETGVESRILRYRLRDNYTRFFLKYVEPNKRAFERGAFRFTRLSSLPGWDSVMGLAFENLVVNNAMELVHFLGIGNATILSAAPFRHARHGRDGSDRGCQIDLLVQTPRTAYAVEVKRKTRIGPEIEDEMEQRLSRIPLRRGVSVRPVLVFDGELDPVVEGDGYFDAVVPASKLLGL